MPRPSVTSHANYCYEITFVLPLLFAVSERCTEKEKQYGWPTQKSGYANMYSKTVKGTTNVASYRLCDCCKRSAIAELQ